MLFADGSVWLLSPDTPVEQLEKFFTVQGARMADRETALVRFCVWRESPLND